MHETLDDTLVRAVGPCPDCGEVLLASGPSYSSSSARPAIAAALTPVLVGD
jgi:hypothetical protein